MDQTMDHGFLNKHPPKGRKSSEPIFYQLNVDQFNLEIAAGFK